MSPRRLRFIGIVWTIGWVAAVALYGLSRVAAETHHDTMLCYRMKAEARAEPRCSEPNAEPPDYLCRFKDAVCEAPIDPGDIALVAAAALVPPALIWALVFFRRRRSANVRSRI